MACQLATEVRTQLQGKGHTAAKTLFALTRYCPKEVDAVVHVHMSDGVGMARLERVPDHQKQISAMVITQEQGATLTPSMQDAGCL